jgi:hypothetical protein
MTDFEDHSSMERREQEAVDTEHHPSWTTYTSPIVLGSSAVVWAAAGVAERLVGVETAADLSFTGAAGCTVGALGGVAYALYARHRQ